VIRIAGRRWDFEDLVQDVVLQALVRSRRGFNCSRKVFHWMACDAIKRARTLCGGLDPDAVAIDPISQPETALLGARAGRLSDTEVDALRHAVTGEGSWRSPAVLSTSKDKAIHTLNLSEPAVRERAKRGKPRTPPGDGQSTPKPSWSSYWGNRLKEMSHE